MKIDEYDIKGVPVEIREWVEDVTLLFNNGKYLTPVVGVAPSWKGRDGEYVMYSKGNVHRIYFYLNNAWNPVEINTQLIKAWVAFSGTGATAIYDSFNVSSITKSNAASWTITWDTDFKTQNYVMSGVCANTASLSVMFSIANESGNPALSSAILRARLDSGTSGFDPVYATLLAVGL